jgi:sugar lactone lactonase YvrE
MNTPRIAARLFPAGSGRWLALAALLFTFAAPATDSPGVSAVRGWRFTVYHDKLPGIDNLVKAEGALYATRFGANGPGQVIKIVKGQVEVLIDGLNNPNGLEVHGRWLYVTEEVAEGRVIERDLCSGKQRELTTLNYPEGVGLLGDGDLAVAEDSINGRLMRVLRNGVVEIITAGLNRPEGLVVARDGTLIFTEAGMGRVLGWRHGDLNVLVDDLEEPNQIELGPDGALWITEDTASGRLLRYRDGALEAILTGLKSPQGITFAGNTVLVAEQGRARILAVSEVPPP